MMYEHAPQKGTIRGNVAPANFLDWRARSHAFSHMGPLRPFSATVSAPGSAPMRADGRCVFGDAFAALGLDPMLGRVFNADDERDGANAVILSYRLWRQQFGADPAIVGRSITLDEVPHTVVGVLKPVLRVPGGPVGFRRDIRSLGDPPGCARCACRIYPRPWHALKSDVTHEQAQADIALSPRGIAREHPQSNKDETVLLVPLREVLVGEVTPALDRCSSARSRSVLVIACVNVASLLLARATGRRQEMTSVWRSAPDG